MQDQRERALQFLKQHGPILPVHLSRILGTNVLMAGAVLSELVATKAVRITSIKRGGSPFYYIGGQEDRLQGLIENLQEKERDAYQLLSKNKVVKDRDAGPVMRVAFRAIKDYAIPITVTSEQGEELFWRWYLSSEEEVKIKVNSLFNKHVEPEKIIESEKEIIVEEKQSVLEKPNIEKPELEIEKPVKSKKEPETEEKKIKIGLSFDAKLKTYFDKHDFVIVHEDQNKKNKEYSFVAKIPSQIGKLDFYVNLFLLEFCLVIQFL